MIDCEICATPNRLDGKFCRECGAPLPQAALDAARQANQRLVDDGYRLLQEGRVEEARLAADTALERDPRLAAAWALRGDARERSGDLAGALEDYEQVLEISPDSTLERLKLTHLRQRLAAQALEAPPPNRRAAVFAGIAATVVVACVGAAIAILDQPVANTPPTASGGMAATPVAGAPGGVPAGGAGSAAPGAAPAAPANPDASATDPAAVAPGTATPGTAAPGTAVPGGAASPANPSPDPRMAAATPPPRLPGGAIRLPDESASGRRPLLPPVGPEIQINPAGTVGATMPAPPANPGPPPSGVDEDPEPVAPGGRAPARNPGIVDIRPSAGNPRPMGGSETIPNRPANPPANANPSPADARNQAEALLRTARQHHQTGDYARAADAYEKAIAAGADPASTHQRLGQTYERLNRRADAVSAYNRAIRAYEAALQNGGGDPARLRAGLASVQQALRLLQGN